MTHSIFRSASHFGLGCLVVSGLAACSVSATPPDSLFGEITTPAPAVSVPAPPVTASGSASASGSVSASSAGAGAGAGVGVGVGVEASVHEQGSISVPSDPPVAPPVPPVPPSPPVIPTAPGSGLPMAFAAAIRSAVDGRCLIFSANGNAQYPERFDWGNVPDFCGLGTKADLLANKQAVFDFTNVGDDNYILTNGSSGVDQCVIFGDNGNDTYPSRYNWGAGGVSAPNCGLPSRADLLANKQAVFRILRTSATTFMIMNSSQIEEKCLIFSANGTAEFPQRFNWGSSLSVGVCGFPDAPSMLLNAQSVWMIDIL